MDTADLDTLAETLTAAGAVSVDTDPAKIRPPGVWIRVDGFDYDVRDASVAWHLTLHLIVPERDPRRSLDALSDLFDDLVPALSDLGGPDNPVSVAGVVLPGSTTPQPALAVPLTVYTE